MDDIKAASDEPSQQAPTVHVIEDMIEGAADGSMVTRVTYLMFMLLVSLNGLVVALLYYLPGTTPAQDQVLYFADVITATLLLVDFFVRLRTAPDRLRYFVRLGWLDLLSALPGLPAVRLLRLPRMVVDVRRLRRETPASLRRAARQRLAESSLLIVGLLVVLVVSYGSFLMVAVEEGAAGANIETGGDAIWWAFVTIATVGYGDTYPVTAYGRLIGIFMLIAGVGLFSVLTSFLAATFLTPAARRERVGDANLHAQIAELHATLARIEARLAQDEERGKE